VQDAIALVLRVIKHKDMSTHTLFSMMDTSKKVCCIRSRRCCCFAYPVSDTNQSQRVHRRLDAVQYQTACRQGKRNVAAGRRQRRRRHLISGVQGRHEPRHVTFGCLPHACSRNLGLLQLQRKRAPAAASGTSSIARSRSRAYEASADGGQQPQKGRV
jgi:hypothetical protein